ncbi:hypothetical protein LXM94_00575 [Rhizobium sp. TRM95111]|uniref:hypothetical protein n=1 Tax=Rhizobium alarense TaxID=2846851 RepID=UPI001F36C56D|nr:hypothetical protein [Rhizobium alarense]MCF3638461.1 hypothetical protein [Rhizobium alarense]
MKPHTLITLLSVAAALASCQSERRTRDLPTAVQQPQGVEGAWVDSNGLLSTFNAGQFDTRTTDGTNAVMATGTYVTQPTGLVEISLFSNITKTASRANCSLVTPTQLNCTSGSGAQFSLTRRG